MRIPYTLYIVAIIVLVSILMWYVAIPVLMIAAVWFIFSELKKRFFPMPVYNRFSHDYQSSENGSEKIIDVEFHEV